MINYAAIKSYLLKRWKVVLIVILSLTVMGKFHHDYSQLQKAYEASQQSLQEQVAGLQAIHEVELKKREEALESYRKALAELEETYMRSQVDLDSTRKELKKRYVKQFSEDKEALVEEIQQAYGFEYVP